MEYVKEYWGNTEYNTVIMGLLLETLTEHIEYIPCNYKDCYNDSTQRLNSEELLLDVFHQMNVNSLGRAMTYLTLVLPNEPYDQRRDSTSSCPFSCSIDVSEIIKDLCKEYNILCYYDTYVWNL